MPGEIQELIGRSICRPGARSDGQSRATGAVRRAHFERTAGAIKKHLTGIASQAELQSVHVKNIAAASEPDYVRNHALAVAHIEIPRRYGCVAGENQNRIACAV